ncbi:hypothetical protein GN956_G15388 [Arapaima gigas]
MKMYNKHPPPFHETTHTNSSPVKHLLGRKTDSGRSRKDSERQFHFGNLRRHKSDEELCIRQAKWWEHHRRGIKFDYTVWAGQRQDLKHTGQPRPGRWVDQLTT